MGVVFRQNYFMINGRSSLEFGIVINNATVWGAPERVYEEVTIPGRNGIILFDEGRYSNANIAYECQLMVKNHNLDAFRGWVLSTVGYQRLEDTYHPEEYRMARPSGEFNATLSNALREGRFTLQFNCKPQRFLKIGEKETTFADDGAIYNPTYYIARPLIRVLGYGTLGVGDQFVTIASHSLSYIDLDCETCNAYCGTTNANSYITLSSDDYPTLGVGTTGISMTGNISQVVVTPRWWSL